MPTIPFRHVDAFTREPFRGNPAVVCLPDEELSEPLMRAIAAEMNVSETAFLHAVPEGGYRLRWFTPRVEVDLCGHATLASAHVLWQEGRLSADAVARFHTRSGLLTARRLSDDWIELDFPRRQPEPAAADPALLAALGIAAPLWSGRHGDKTLLEISDETAVRAARPDFSRLRAIGGVQAIVTARARDEGQESAAEDQADFVSRYFGPGVGIDEDPVTGSAHCVLGPYWEAKLGRSRLVGYQASARGGWVKVEMAAGRVKLGGQALTLTRGEICVEPV